MAEVDLNLDNNLTFTNTVELPDGSKFSITCDEQLTIEQVLTLKRLGYSNLFTHCDNPSEVLETIQKDIQNDTGMAFVNIMIYINSILFYLVKTNHIVPRTYDGDSGNFNAKE